jgi:hypothetical protein
MHDADLFFTSPSPGTVALFMENKHYPDDEAYIEADRDGPETGVRHHRRLRVPAADRLPGSGHGPPYTV